MGLHAVVLVVCALPIVRIGAVAHSVFGLAGSAIRLDLITSVGRLFGVGIGVLVPAISTVSILCLLTRSGQWGSRCARIGSLLVGAVGLLLGAAVWATGQSGLGSAGVAQSVAELTFVMVGLWLLGWSIVGAKVASAETPAALRRTVPAILGVVALFCAVSALTIWALGRRPANSPAQSAQSFSDALDAGDLVTVAEQLDPRERNVLIRSGVPMLAQLRRLKMIDPGTATKPVRFRSNASPISIGKVRMLGTDMAAVDTTGTFAVPRALVRSAGNRIAKSMSKPSQIVSVRIDGHWYVSILYSVAEVRRLQSNVGEPFPKVVQSVGSANPEGAVLDLFSAIAAVDLERTVAVLDPTEAAFSHQYARILTKDGEKAQQWSQSNAIGSFPNLGLSSEVSGDRAVVKVIRWSAELTLPSDLGSGSNILLDGNCVTATVEKETSEHCGKEIPKVVADLFGVKAPNLGDLAWLERPREQLEFVVVRRNGAWFVAPVSSVLNSITLRMSSMKPADVAGKNATKQWQQILLGTS